MSSLTQLVQGFEGWNPKAYGDYKQYSVGYGTKARYPGEVIDKAEGERRLQSELNEARGYVTKRFPGLAPNQADALTSFTYNLGPGWMNQPTRLRAALEAGDTKTAASVMREYNKAGGAVLPGLVKRRDAEARLFLGDGVTPDQPAQATAAGPIMASGRKYTPEEVIQGRYQFANQLWREPQASPHWASVLAEGLKGVGSGLARSGAEEALTGNRDMTEEAMRNAANAPDNVTMAKLLLGSGVPDLGKQGMNLIVQDRKAAADRAADFDQRKKLMELQGEQNLAQARAMAPIEREKIEATIRLKSQLEQEALNKRLEMLGLTPGQAPDASSAPQPAPPSGGPAGSTDDPYLSMLSPAKTTSDDAERKKKAATALALGQEGQAAKILAGESEPKEYQTKDASLAERMIRSELDLRRVTPIDAKGNFTKYDPTGAAQRLWWDDSYWNSNEWKEYQRGAREWIAALLRKDTGAAVTDSEFKLYVPTYFPLPGDSPQVVLDKQRARMALARGLRSGSGPAFEKMFPRFDQEMRQRLAAMDPETYGDKRGQPKATTNAGPASTFDDAKAIPEGARVKDGQGRVFIKRNGQLIPVTPDQASSVTMPSGEVAAP